MIARRLHLILVASAIVATLVAGCDTVSREVSGVIPAQGGTLRLAGASPETLDPARVQDVQTFGYLLEIYSGLVRLDNKLQVKPDIATSWEVSADGRTYTFQLRTNAKFQDGRPVTAEDVKYGIERALDPSTQSPVADVYLGDIVGAKERLVGTSPNVTGVVVKSPYVLDITIDSPKTYFLAKLTYPTAFAVDRQNVESGPDWAAHPNGSGPFKLKSYTPDQSLVLVRNSSYYGAMPTLAEVDYDLGLNNPMSLYQADKVDVAGLTVGDIPRATDPEGPFHASVTATPLLSLWYVGFDVKARPFDDPHVRRAFAYATDKQTLANILYRETRGLATGIVPPGLVGYDSSFAGLPFDPQRAKDELGLSAYGSAANLPTIRFALTGDGGAVGQAFAQMYRKNLGVNVEVDVIEGDVFKDLRDHSVQMFYLGWVADYPDPQDFVDILFGGSSAGNYTEYANPEVDALLRQAANEGDANRRATLYQAAQRKIVDDTPAIPLFYETDYNLVRPTVTGLTITPMGIISFEGVQISR
jgi:oligopeptide transport system substrate-binding protein